MGGAGRGVLRSQPLACLRHARARPIHAHSAHPDQPAGQPRDLVRRIVRAGFWAAALSGVPSTLWSVRHGRDPLEAARAAGRMLVPRETQTVPLVGAAALVHGVLSSGWTVVIAATLPRDAGRARSVLHGALMGAAIAGADLGLAHVVRHPRLAAIRALPLGPQVGDHVAFGAIAGLLLRRT